jgi:hypothetical protein
MNSFEWTITTAISVLAILLIPAIGLLIRIVVKWTKTEARLEDLADDMKKLVNDKDRIHTEMLGQMREDRAATDRRLRWLEEYLWWRGGGEDAIRNQRGGR